MRHKSTIRFGIYLFFGLAMLAIFYYFYDKQLIAESEPVIVEVVDKYCLRTGAKAGRIKFRYTAKTYWKRFSKTFCNEIEIGQLIELKYSRKKDDFITNDHTSEIKLYSAAIFIAFGTACWYYSKKSSYVKD